ILALRMSGGGHRTMVRSGSASNASASPPMTASTTIAPTPLASTTTIAPSPPPPSSPEATALCEQRLSQLAGGDNPLHVSLVAAYTASAKDVAADDEHRNKAHGRS